MSLLTKILLGLGIAVVLVVVIVVAAGNWGSGAPEAQTLSMTVGNHTVTVSGHYKNLTQESMADGIKVVVDGHEITVNQDQLTIDGKTQVLEQDQDVMITVDEKGAVDVKVVHADEPAPEAPEPPDESGAP